MTVEERIKKEIEKRFPVEEVVEKIFQEIESAFSELKETKDKEDTTYSEGFWNGRMEIEIRSGVTKWVDRVDRNNVE